MHGTIRHRHRHTWSFAKEASDETVCVIRGSHLNAVAKRALHEEVSLMQEVPLDIVAQKALDEEVCLVREILLCHLALLQDASSDDLFKLGE